MKLKKGDQVKIIAGKDRGKIATVTRAFPKENKIAAEGVNLYKKRVKPRKAGQKGEIVIVARPLPSSNAMIICPNCKIPSRVGYRFESALKIRFCKKCKARIT
ncbi:MAG: 50S ribosomal protein L24 [Candidatus Liptonbacteria bacterium]|nr:50S ribosomal protein L24 [Candidatus Liptonbacteria bacterium]